MKLYARTPGGIGLGINVLLTGQVKEVNGKIRDVEITLPSGCDGITGFTATPLPKAPNGRAILWADPHDLCLDDGGTMNHDTLIAEIKRAAEHSAKELRTHPQSSHAQVPCVTTGSDNTVLGEKNRP